MKLPYVRFPGIRGDQLSEQQREFLNEAEFKQNTGRNALDGEVGCYLSHLRVWQLLCDSKKEYALVLEDDVVFHEEFRVALKQALRWSDQWEIVRFNCIRAKVPITRISNETYRLNEYIGPFTGNGAYLIKKETARNLLVSMKAMSRPHDHELNRFFIHNFRLTGLEPWPSHVDDKGKSTITGQKFDKIEKSHWSRRLPYYKQKIINYVLRALWLLRNRRS